MCPGVLLLRLAVGDLANQLVVLDLEMALEHLRHHHRTRGLGVYHTTAVKLLKMLTLNMLHSYIYFFADDTWNILRKR